MFGPPRKLLKTTRQSGYNLMKLSRNSATQDRPPGCRSTGGWP